MSLTELLDAPSGSTAAAVDATVDTALDAPHAGQTETDLENSILTRARQLRLSNIKG